MSSSFVNFNVGGKSFTTSKETILREPASRLALLVRGVLPATHDASDAIFLDRDAHYFQLVLNYLRDGWCSLPKTAEERRALLQEVRYLQLAGMEAWMRTQDVLGDAALGSPNSLLVHPLNLGGMNSQRPALNASRLAAGGMSGLSLAYQQPLVVTAGSPDNASPANAAAAAAAACSSPAAMPLRTSNSFLTGPNQDLLAAGAVAGFSSSYSGNGSNGRGQAVYPIMSDSAGCYTCSSICSRPCSAPQNAFAGSLNGYAGALGGPCSPAAAAGMAAYTSVTGAGSCSYYATPAPADKRLMAVAQNQSPGQFWDSGDWMMARQGLTAGVDGRSTAAGAADHLPRRYWQATDADHIPASSVRQFQWTARYLQNNPKMQEVVETLMELASLPPHPSLHAGKTTISFSCECDHDKVSNLLGPAPLGCEEERIKYQVIRVKSSMGWSFEFSLRPSSDLVLYHKYSIAEFIQDNWFVLAAVLKDSFSVIMEEDKANRPNCLACRRSNVSIILQKQ